MYYIHTHEIITQRELSLLMHVADSSAARLLDRLERDGMVIRSPHESDRRVTLVRLTEMGDALIRKLIPYGDAFNNDLTEGIDQQELVIFEKVLSKMIENIQEMTTEIREL